MWLPPENPSLVVCVVAYRTTVSLLQLCLSAHGKKRNYSATVDLTEMASPDLDSPGNFEPGRVRGQGASWEMRVPPQNLFE